MGRLLGRLIRCYGGYNHGLGVRKAATEETRKVPQGAIVGRIFRNTSRYIDTNSH